jgi:hypothetical protein
MRSVARVCAVLALLVSGVPANDAAAQEFERFIGTWVLNASKSQWGTSKPPQSQIRTFDYSHDGWIVCTWRNVGASGNRGFVHWFSKLDGQHNPEFSRGRGRQSTSSIAVKKIDESTINVEGRTLPEGKYLFSGTATVSQDGKTLTWTMKDVYQGKENLTVRIYEKENAGTTSTARAAAALARNE